MAGEACWSIRIASGSGFTVDARPEFFYFIGMALHALCGNNFCRLRNLMRIAMA
jgi:hypothetical protein